MMCKDNFKSVIDVSYFELCLTYLCITRCEFIFIISSIVF